MVESQVEGKLLVLKDASNRQELLSCLNRVIELAVRYYTNRYTKSADRIAWGRLIANSAKAAAFVLRDEDLADLLKRVETLERGVKFSE